MTHSQTLRTLYGMRYLRVSTQDFSEEPEMTLYEVDASGWVHRLTQLRAERTRFAPDDIVLCAPLDFDGMLLSGAEEVTREEFELLWMEVWRERPFLDRVPNPELEWNGTITIAGGNHEICWCPDRERPAGWTLVPGFTRLFAKDGGAMRKIGAAILADAPLHWEQQVALAA